VAFIPPPSTSSNNCSITASGDARIEQFPADGKIFYGTQKSRPAWDAEFAELWELRETSTGWERQTSLANWDRMPITLAQDSESGEATAYLVDVNNGTAESDYANKGRAREIRTGLGTTRCSGASGSGTIRRGRNRELRAEPAHRVVG
jgi:hypothetical protein